jgi:cobalt-precorrin 5A hydrolase
MSLRIISFTEKGADLSERIAGQCGEKAVLFTKCSLYKEKDKSFPVRFVQERVGDWAKVQMEAGNTLLFIGACGIAVRAIAPWVSDKLYDSPVLVMDEKGDYIIPILSGHVGGSNEIAVRLAEKTGAIPVITTATDLSHKFAVDLFAKRNGLHIKNKDGIARVSSKVLAGKTVTLSVEPGHISPNIKLPPEIKIAAFPPREPVDILVTTEEINCQPLITLIPKEYVIGMGCRKGKEAEKIEFFIRKSMEEAGIGHEQIFALASIDIKKEEEGLLAWSRKAGIPFLTFSAEQLQELEGNFHASDFVKEQVGTDNVCERASLKACGMGGRLIYEKHAEDGMTIAISKREWSVSFDEE